MIRTEEILSFVQTVDAGSITLAATRMRIAKSSVSRHIVELERRLGVQLLNRTTRRMTLTAAGTELYAAGRRLLDDVGRLENAVQSAATALSGRIRLSAPSAFGPHYVGPALIEFVESEPAIDFDIEFTDRQIDVVKEGFDLAIRIARLRDSRLRARRIARLPTSITASPGYWRAHGKPRRPADLTHHRCLHFSDQRTAVWRYRTRGGQSGSVRVAPILQANNGEFLVSAAERGLGVICQPRFMTARAVDAGLLENALTTFQWRDLHVYVVYPETRHLPRRTRELIDFLARRWADGALD